MQLKVRGLFTVIAFATIFGCSKRADIVIGQAPFINQRCSYTSVNRLIEVARSAAIENGLQEKNEITDNTLGVYSILLWKKDFNIIITGIPRTKLLYFDAIKRGIANSQDRDLASNILKSLPLTCNR